MLLSCTKAIKMKQNVNVCSNPSSTVVSWYRMVTCCTYSTWLFYTCAGKIPQYVSTHSHLFYLPDVALEWEKVNVMAEDDRVFLPIQSLTVCIVQHQCKWSRVVEILKLCRNSFIRKTKIYCSGHNWLASNMTVEKIWVARTVAATMAATWLLKSWPPAACTGCTSPPGTCTVAIRTRKSCSSSFNLGWQLFPLSERIKLKVVWSSFRTENSQNCNPRHKPPQRITLHARKDPCCSELTWMPKTCFTQGATMASNGFRWLPMVSLKTQWL